MMLTDFFSVSFSIFGHDVDVILFGDVLTTIAQEIHTMLVEGV